MDASSSPAVPQDVEQAPLTEQEEVDQLIAKAKAMELAEPGPTPEEIEAQVAVLEAQQKAEYAKAGAAIWPMHNRRCRRALQLKHEVKPTDFMRQMALCKCGWPQARLEQFRKEQEDARMAAIEAEKALAVELVPSKRLQRARKRANQGARDG